MTVLDAVRRRAELRAHPELPLVDPRAVLVGAGWSAGLYVLLTAWALPGLVDIVAALPVGARIGVLLLASTATRFAAGWVAARRFRAGHGLPERTVAVPSAALGGLVGFLLVSVLALVGGGQVSAWAVLADALRWPVECAVGALLALPGPPEQATRHHPSSWRTRS
jgi:hypothetical protein